MDRATLTPRSIVGRAGLLVAFVVATSAAACSSADADESASPDGRSAGEPGAPPGAAAPGSDPGGSSGAGAGGGAGGTPVPGVEIEAGLQHVAGTRLRPHWNQTASGEREFVAWFDAQLGAECSFGPASDGELRCLPNAGPSAGATSNCAGQTLLSLAHVSQLCGTPKYVRRDLAGCPKRVQITAVGALTSCKLADPSSYNGALDFYADGGEVAPATFVKGTRSRKVLGKELAMNMIAGADGSSGIESFVDVAHDVPCDFAKAADGAIRCLPRDAARLGGNGFGDAACTSPRASGEACGASKFGASKEGTPVCDPRQTIRQLGAPTAGPRYLKNGTMCMTFGTLGTSEYPIGGEVGAATFPAAAAKPSTSTSTARLRPVALESGSASVRTGWFDAVRNEACTIKVAADGVRRCLPSATDGTYTYSDPACTKPVHFAYASICQDAKYIGSTREEISCPAVNHLYARGASKTGPTYNIFNGVCKQGGSYPYIEAGPEVPPSAFEAVTPM